MFWSSCARSVNGWTKRQPVMASRVWRVAEALASVSTALSAAHVVALRSVLTPAKGVWDKTNMRG